MAVYTSGNPVRSFSFIDFKSKLEYLYESRRATTWDVNPDKIEMAHHTILNLDLILRKQFHRFLLKERRKDLADFFQEKYLIKMGLKGMGHSDEKGLIERVKSAMTDSPVAYAIELYELSIKKRSFNYADWDSYQQHLRKLSRKEKIEVYGKLNKVNPDAANYFSQKFVFMYVTLNIPI